MSNPYNAIKLYSHYFTEIEIRRLWFLTTKTSTCWIHETGKFYKHYVPGVMFRSTLNPVRVMYAIVYGETPDPPEYVLHTCDNGRCVRPEHVYAGTQLRNLQDAVERGRLNNRKGEHNTQAKLSAIDVAEIKTLYAHGMTLQGLAALYPVSFQHISRIINGSRWSEPCV